MQGIPHHPSTLKLLGWFENRHLPDGPIREASAACELLAKDMAAGLPSSPELTTGLRKLLEAKDCFVRAAIDVQSALAPAEPSDP